MSCSSFTSSLADFLRTYQNVPHTSTGHSPAIWADATYPSVYVSTAERVKASLQPSENLLPPRLFKKGEDVWVRDYWPNAIYKWTKAVIESVDGPLNYSVVLDNGHFRQLSTCRSHYRSSRTTHVKLNNNCCLKTPRRAEGHGSSECSTRREPFP